MAETKTIHRYQVPIDDAPHEFTLTAWPVDHVEAVLANDLFSTYVEFWAESYGDIEPFVLTFQVFGTGHKIPEDAIYIGTAPRAKGLVFHLYLLDDNE